MKCNFRFAFPLIVSTGARVATLLIYHMYWTLPVYGPLKSGPRGERGRGPANHPRARDLRRG
jgi:hypothetical protein